MQRVRAPADLVDAGAPSHQHHQHPHACRNHGQQQQQPWRQWLAELARPRSDTSSSERLQAMSSSLPSNRVQDHLAQLHEDHLAQLHGVRMAGG
jgi:hypothetical protein